MKISVVTGNRLQVAGKFASRIMSVLPRTRQPGEREIHLYILLYLLYYCVYCNVLFMYQNFRQ